MKLEVGQVLPMLKGAGDNIRFGMSDAGAELLVCFRSPTEAEIQTIKKGPIRFGMFTKENIIFILVKFGSMPWMDAPFHAGLARNLTKLQDIEEGQGYGCTVLLADSSTGVVKVIRYIGFGTEYSRRLKRRIEEQMNDPFDESEYDNNLYRIMKNYFTRDMVRFSEVNYRIRGDE